MREREGARVREREIEQVQKCEKEREREGTRVRERARELE